ncbi:hypothetical protein QPK77_14845 [Providencia rettgeri]|nr:hypothetical protein [Providencia rettgeri]MDK3009197.1 hypothetical protein [Providencia rettgeri]
MFNICILVLIYNKKPFESRTINSLKKYHNNLNNCSITIWNNGPNTILPLSTSPNDDLKIGDCEINIIETIQNTALSEVYNTFIKNNNSNKYVILDDDSELTNEYIQAINTLELSDIAFPLITCKRKARSPIIDNCIQSNTGTVSEKQNILAIGSGMTINKRTISALNNYFGNVFDERFRFYGVDITFCYRINKIRKNEKFQVTIIDGFEHSLSKMEVESREIKNFRRKERSYDLALRLKYYYTKPYSLLILSKAILTSIKNNFFSKESKYNYADLLKAYFSGKHYKD